MTVRVCAISTATAEFSRTWKLNKIGRNSTDEVSAVWDVVDIAISNFITEKDAHD